MNRKCICCLRKKQRRKTKPPEEDLDSDEENCGGDCFEFLRGDLIVFCDHAATARFYSS
jgi:hypothetical protein